MRAIKESMQYIRGSIIFVVLGIYNDIHHNKAFSIMILSNPDGVGWLKFSKTASRIAPSSTARTEDFSSDLIVQVNGDLPKNTGKTVPLIPRIGVSKFFPLQ